MCGIDGTKCTLNQALVSPNYPAKYPLDIRCSHQISVEEGKRITLEFVHFEVRTIWNLIVNRNETFFILGATSLRLSKAL